MDALSLLSTSTTSLFRMRPGYVFGGQGQTQWASPRQFGEMLRAYYLNNGLYDEVSRAMFEVQTWAPAMKPLRNPASRAVEFYVSTVWPGVLPSALPIVTDNDAIVEPIHLVWQWSNLTEKKQLATRQFSINGECFMRVSTTPSANRVYLKLINPLDVTDYTLDERGFVKEIRIDVDLGTKSGRQRWHTEHWSETTGYRRWEHDKGDSESLERLGDAAEVRSLATWGIDFVPFVAARFKDVGEPRGVGCFTMSLDKIDEANLMATRLHQLLFKHNKNHWVVSANQVDPTGRPIPAPRIGSTQGTEESDSITLGDDVIFRLPGNSTLQSMVPPINYEAALKILTDHLLEVERDMPELTYWRVREMGELSGKAIRLMLRDAEQKTVEARASLERALARANMMALTIGKFLGIEQFAAVGEFDKGELDHTFQERDVFPLSEAEVWENVKMAVEAGLPLVSALKRNGFSDDEIKEITSEQEKVEAKQAKQLAATMLKAQRDFDAGNQNGNQPPQSRTNGQPPSGNGAASQPPQAATV